VSCCTFYHYDIIHVVYYSVGLNDDRTESFLQAIRQRLEANTQIVSIGKLIATFYKLLFQVICLLPSNRKDRYDAIKKLCCVECPGVFHTFAVATESCAYGLLSFIF